MQDTLLSNETSLKLMFVLPRTDGNVAYLGRAILIYPFT